MPFKKLKEKKVYEHKKPKPRIDWDDPTDVWILDMSKPEHMWRFERAKK